MTDDEFWGLIARVDQQILSKSEGYDEAAIAPLISALSLLSKDKLEAFEEQLARKLYVIDGEIFCDQAGEAGNSTDGFLYVRCFVVARGRDVYEATVRNPQLMPKTLDDWCEPLLYAAGMAWAKQNGKDLDDWQEDWQYIASISYETGSNPSQW
jgi:hypothetical protein